MTDAMLEARTQRRQQLRANGYMPLPLFGKVPRLRKNGRRLERDLVRHDHDVGQDLARREQHRRAHAG